MGPKIRMEWVKYTTNIWAGNSQIITLSFTDKFGPHPFQVDSCQQLLSGRNLSVLPPGRRHVLHGFPDEVAEGARPGG